MVTPLSVLPMGVGNPHGWRRLNLHCKEIERKFNQKRKKKENEKRRIQEKN